LTGAYQVFADQGQRVPQHSILNIWDNYGDELYHYDASHPDATQVITPQIAFLVDNILSDNASRVYEFGGTDTLTFNDWNGQEGADLEVAAKTGTTSNDLDNWTMGFTTSLVVGVWSGNADGNDPMNGVIGLTGAGGIWHDIIEYASGRVIPAFPNMKTDLNYPPTPFPTPATGIVQGTVNTVNGLAGTGNTDWMLTGEEPSQAGVMTTTCTTNQPGNHHFYGQQDTQTPCAGNTY
jgi:membrane peptidoglycan carboxypeptidase